MHFLINLVRVIAIQTEANYAWHLHCTFPYAHPFPNKFVQSYCYSNRNQLRMASNFPLPRNYVQMKIFNKLF